METRRFILFFIFIFSLITLWEQWQKYPPRLREMGISSPNHSSNPGASVGTNNTGNTSSADPSLPNLPKTSPGTLPAPSQMLPSFEEKGTEMTVETDLMVVRIASVGGDIRGLSLKKYRADGNTDEAFNLLGETHQYYAQSGLLNTNINLPNHKTHYTFVEAVKQQVLGDGKNNLRVDMKIQTPEAIITKTYTFTRGSYAIGVHYTVQNLTKEILSPAVYWQIMRDGKAPSGDNYFMPTFSGAVFYTDKNKFNKQDFSDLGKKRPVPVAPATDGWAGFAQHYFASVWLPTGNVSREFYARPLDNNLYSVGIVHAIDNIPPNQHGETQATLFVGPQETDLLESLSPGLGLIKDYGWLTIIAQPMYWLLKTLYDGLGNWGLAIITMTILLKALFFPLSAASYRSMARMKQVAPRLMALRERYGDDRIKMNQAMMDIYRTEKINPLGGCLPILIQIPVFIALYWVILGTVELRQAPFYGWITDLSAQDPYYVLPTLMAISMYVQTKMNPTPPDPLQAKLMMIMPLVFSVFFFFFPSGLVLYWLVNNILSIAQQWQITRIIEKTSKSPS